MSNTAQLGQNVFVRQTSSIFGHPSEADNSHKRGIHITTYTPCYVSDITAKRIEIRFGDGSTMKFSKASQYDSFPYTSCRADGSKMDRYRLFDEVDDEEYNHAEALAQIAKLEKETDEHEAAQKAQYNEEFGINDIDPESPAVIKFIASERARALFRIKEAKESMCDSVMNISSFHERDALNLKIATFKAREWDSLLSDTQQAGFDGKDVRAFCVNWYADAVRAALRPHSRRDSDETNAFLEVMDSLKDELELKIEHVWE